MSVEVTKADLLAAFDVPPEVVAALDAIEAPARAQAHLEEQAFLAWAEHAQVEIAREVLAALAALPEVTLGCPRCHLADPLSGETPVCTCGADW